MAPLGSSGDLYAALNELSAKCLFGIRTGWYCPSCFGVEVPQHIAADLAIEVRKPGYELLVVAILLVTGHEVTATGSFGGPEGCCWFVPGLFWVCFPSGSTAITHGLQPTMVRTP